MGSAIDDVQMDQATFFKLYHSLRSEEDVQLTKLIAISPDNGSFLEKWNKTGQTAIGSMQKHALGTSRLSLQCLSHALSVRDTLKDLVQASIDC
jgi:hypothetical protein